MAKIYHKGSNIFDYDDLTQGYSIGSGTGLPTPYSGRFATTTPIDVTGLGIVELTFGGELVDNIRVISSVWTDNDYVRTSSLRNGTAIDCTGADSLYLAFYLAGSGSDPLLIEDVPDITVTPTWQPYTPKIMTESNNILNVEIEEGAYNQTTGEKQNSSTAYRTANRTAVSPSTDYCFGVNGVQYAVYAYEYKADGTFIQYSSITQNTYFTTTAETAYINFARNIASGSEKWQLNEGQTLLAYENPGLIWKEKADKEYTSDGWQ